MRSPGIRSAPPQVLPAPRPKAMGFVVVLALHGVFIAALNAGLGRKLLESPAMVVFADMISAPSTPPVPPPPPKEVVTPKASAAPTPAPIPTQPVPLAEPTPVATAPSNAIAPPTPAPSTPPAPTAKVAAPVAAPAMAPPVRVAAHLQASGTCQKPEYPALSRRREEQGSVMLRFLIGIDGNVLESQIAQSSGFARLDEAARAALSKCQFKPGTVDGIPEPSWASLKYTWRLD